MTSQVKRFRLVQSIVNTKSIITLTTEVKGLKPYVKWDFMYETKPGFLIGDQKVLKQENVTLP